MKDPTVLGLTEDVTVIGKSAEKTVHARIDTGAVSSSIDVGLAAELNLGPVLKTKIVKSANGKSRRAIVKVPIKILGRTCDALCTLADRSHMNYKVLIGQDVLKQGFLIDPNKNTLLIDEDEDHGS